MKHWAALSARCMRANQTPTSIDTDPSCYKPVVSTSTLIPPPSPRSNHLSRVVKLNPNPSSSMPEPDSHHRSQLSSSETSSSGISSRNRGQRQRHSRQARSFIKALEKAIRTTNKDWIWYSRPQLKALLVDYLQCVPPRHGLAYQRSLFPRPQRSDILNARSYGQLISELAYLSCRRERAGVRDVSRTIVR